MKSKIYLLFLLQMPLFFALFSSLYIVTLDLPLVRRLVGKYPEMKDRFSRVSYKQTPQFDEFKNNYQIGIILEPSKRFIHFMKNLFYPAFAFCDLFNST